ncbi:MAG: TIGR00366 family protein [Bacteroidota bacterium]
MNFANSISRIFGKYLPSPFTIAVLLTFVTLFLAWGFTENTSDGNHLLAIFSYWEGGVWNTGLLVFGYQMMLILVLGHVLVLSRPIERLILRLTVHVTDAANAAVLVALPTMLVSFFNWGLGLIFGAILARKVGEYAQAKAIPINYPLIGACGYVGLMVWHGGISGSAPIKVSEAGHLRDLMTGISNSRILDHLPDTIPTSQTVLSTGNLLIFSVVLITMALLAFRLGKSARPSLPQLSVYRFYKEDIQQVKGAERWDRSRGLATLFGIFILAVFAVQYSSLLGTLNITPNMLNLFMLGLAFLMHGSFKSFLNAVEEAIGDTAGILIQFPLYFGIMGIMGGSGMIQGISNFFVSVSNEATLPLFTFFSAGLVNVFVPSGGGQWALQGPMVIEAAIQLNVPLPKAIMALAYGDQVTNMLQPFWALPLLGITKLKAREVLPYTLIFMVAGSCIYLAGLLIF